MKASPLEQIMKRFGDTKDSDRAGARKNAKAAGIKAVRDFVKKGDLLDDDFSDKGLERISNKKLVKLLEIAGTVQDEFGSRAALIDKVLEIEKRQKDSDYREHLEGYRLPALYSYYGAARNRA